MQVLILVTNNLILKKISETQEIASENENAFNIDDPPATEAELSPSSSSATLINDGAGCSRV